MLFEKLIALVPLSRIDPDPAELTDQVAEAVLESYRTLWHPALLSRSATLPVWARPADPPVAAPGQLILIPRPSHGLLPSGWEGEARAAGAQVIVADGTADRLLASLWESLSIQMGAAEPIEIASFLALGVARLWLEMVTAYMRHLGTLDEDRFQREVLAAASAAVLADATTCDNHLRAAFQLLTEAREQIYPAEVHLLDLCLLDPRIALDRLGAQLRWGLPVNVFLSGRTAEQLRGQEPTMADELRVALDAGTADLVGGEFDEVASTLLPLESHLWQFRRGERSYREVLGRSPLVYGRRRFGLARYLLQLIHRWGMLSMTHFCFDGGSFPTPADPRVRWEAPDSTTVEALTRVPFAADNALDFLKFPARLAQTLSKDHTATLPLVHWPMPQAPWYEDLLRITQYSNVFGRFFTLSNYFQTTSQPLISTRPSSDDYGSPFLEYAHHLMSKQPISEFPKFHRLRARLETVRWLAAVSQALGRQSNAASRELDELEELVELQGAAAAERVGGAEQHFAQALAATIDRPSGGHQTGLLLFNSLGFDRQVVVPLHSSTDALTSGPDVSPTGKSVPECVSVDLPAMGFAWIARQPSASSTGTESGGAVVEGQLIRNAILEVEIDAASGGIRSLRRPASGANQLGQRLVVTGIGNRSGPAYDPAYAAGGGAGAGNEPFQAVMRATSRTIQSAGPELAQVLVEGELIAQPRPSWASEPRLARFRQSYQLGRGQSMVRVAIEILDLASSALDARSSPWESYLASRFAWPDARAMVVRGIGSVSEPTRSGRPETAHFLELHSGRYRTAILTGGLPFHQRFGDRMLDMLLVTATETARCFEFGVGLDLANPFHAALDLITPPAIITCEGAPPPCGPAGWFFHLDVRNVVITQVTPLGLEAPGVCLRMFESAGRYTRARLRCVRDVSQARMTDFRGQRLATLDAQGDTVPIDLAPHEITQVEIEFA